MTNLWWFLGLMNNFILGALIAKHTNASVLQLLTGYVVGSVIAFIVVFLVLSWMAK